MTDELYFYLVPLVMAAVSYPLRFLPATVISKVRFGRYMRRVLYLIPYTALTALVFPGIFYSVGDHYYVATAGTVCALVTSILRLPLSVTVVLSVATVFVMLLL